MKLYYSDTLNPRKACAVAQYVKAPVEYVWVSLPKGEQTTPAFLAMNPNGKVPVLVHEGGTLWEANAIMGFLARAAGSDLWPPEDKLVEMVRWLSWDLQHFTRYTGALYFEYVIKPKFGIGPVDDKAVAEATDNVRKYAQILNDHLRGRRYVLDTLSIVDFAVGIALPYAEQAHIPLDEFPEVQRWHDRLNELPAWREPFPARTAAA